MDHAQRRNSPGLFSFIATTVIAGLAMGAVWCLLSLKLAFVTGFLIVPLAGVIGAYFRWLRLSKPRGAICAVATVLIAFIYAQWLFAAVRVAQMLGFPLRNTVFNMDPALAWQAAAANLGVWNFAWLALGCAFAAWLAARGPVGR